MFDGTSTHCAGSSPVLSLSISLRLLFEVTERCHGNWAGTRIKLRHWIFWVSGDNEINGRRSGMSTSPLSLSPPPPPKHTLPQAAVTKLYKHSPLPLPGKERCGRGGGRGEEDRVTRTLFVLVIAGSTPGGRPPPDGARNEGNGSFQSIGFWIDSSRRLPLGYQLLETWQS